MEKGKDEIHEGVVVAAPAWLEIERKSRYGSVEGLEDEELADPTELERQVILRELEPLFSIPAPKKEFNIRPEIRQDGHVDWGAFGTIDFERLFGKFDKAQYKVDKLREKLKDVVIMLEIIGERIPGKGKYLVLKYLREGVIELEHIPDEDMRALARWFLRAQRIREEIRGIEESRRSRGQGFL
jgi:hypothetical protein